MKMRYGQGLQIVPLEIAAETAAFASEYVEVGNSHWVTFGVLVGTCDTATTITIEESTANSSNATEAAIPFTYRLSGAVASDSWGAVTTCDSAGVGLVATTDNNKLLLIDVDPRTLDAGYNYLRVVGAATSYSTAMATAIFVILEPRYAQGDPLSSS